MLRLPLADICKFARRREKTLAARQEQSRAGGEGLDEAKDEEVIKKLDLGRGGRNQA
jgi:hypothetical protein